MKFLLLAVGLLRPWPSDMYHMITVDQGGRMTNVTISKHYFERLVMEHACSRIVIDAATQTCVLKDFPSAK